MINHPPVHRIEVVPDWVCEVLSPSTESKDRKVKMGSAHETEKIAR
jgi:Uma2 family endonuclease